MGAEKYEMVVFDVDGTLVTDTVFVWESIHDAYETDPAERKRIIDAFFAGEITYEEWFNEDLRLLREAGATREGLLDVIRSMSLMGGAAETLRELKKAGMYLVIISGTVDLVVKHFGLDRLVDEYYCNLFSFDEGGLLTGGVATKYDIDAKADGLIHVAAARGVPLSKTVYVGDNFNDVTIAQKAGLSIAFNCKSQKLAEVASHVIPGGDMRAILPCIFKK